MCVGNNRRELLYGTLYNYVFNVLLIVLTVVLQFSLVNVKIMGVEYSLILKISH